MTAAACSSVHGLAGLFWIDAAIAAACVPVTLAAVEESLYLNRSRSIDDRRHDPRSLWLSVPIILGAEQGQRLGLDVARDARILRRGRDRDRCCS